MADALAKGRRVEIRGLCSFYVKKYKSYTGRNPKTGKKVKIKPKKLPLFKCGKELRKRVNSLQKGATMLNKKIRNSESSKENAINVKKNGSSTTMSNKDALQSVKAVLCLKEMFGMTHPQISEEAFGNPNKKQLISDLKSLSRLPIDIKKKIENEEIHWYKEGVHIARRSKTGQSNKPMEAKKDAIKLTPFRGVAASSR